MGPNVKKIRTTTSTSSNSGRLAIVYKPIGDLTLDPRNARQHSKRQVRQLADSIRVFQFNVPILVGAGNNVIAGHARLLACRELGMTEVPTIPLTHLTLEQVSAFKLADNKLASNATWNDKLLGEALRDLSALDLEFDLEITGFDMGEIDLRIGSLEVETDVAADRADELPAVEKVAVTQAGDLWILGQHRVLCGSALEPTSFETLLGGALADVVFTDPPYNVPIDGHVSGLGEITHREFAMAVGEMSEQQFTCFLATACTLLASHSKLGSLHYLCMDWRHMMELQAAARSAYKELKNVCVWVKSNGGMGSLYRSRHELVFVFKNGAVPHRNNVSLGRHGRNRTNVWQYPGVSSFGHNDRERDLLSLHPTVKPVALIADAILDCSARGEVVLDAFLGSGSTLIAAERTGRRCFGMELDPLYVDTIIRRWQRFVGASARHAVSGEAFDALAAKCPSAKPDNKSLQDGRTTGGNVDAD